MADKIEYVSSIPVQTVSYNDKVKDDFQWCKATMRAYIDRSYFTTTQHKIWLKRLYDYYNGHVDIEDYKLITEPFGKKLEGDWSDVLNYPIIKTKIDLLMGEYAKRPKNKEVYCTNDDVTNKEQEELKTKILSSLEQQFINELNEGGVQTGVPSQPQPPPEYIQKEHNSSYRDQRAIIGQHSLEFIEQYCRLDEKFHLAFFHWLVSGEVYSYKSIELNEVNEEIVNPLDIDFDKDPDLQFIEDGDWVVRRKYMNPSSIVEFLYEDLGKNEKERREMIQKIEQLAVNGPTLSSSSPYLYDRSSPYRSYSRLVEVKHCVWRGKQKVGICTFTDEMGQEQSMEVDETFKPVKELGQEVEWYWTTQIWEGYLIGQEIFVRMRACPVQRGSMDNLSKCKLPYNGRALSNINSRNISLVTLGIPYQVLVNATMHRLKLAMAKMKDDMAVIDINLKPKQFSLEEWLMFGDATNILFIDPNKEGVRPSPHQSGAMKFASSTIQSYIELLRFIKGEWDEVCGITRQREGQVNTSETVGGVERAVVQSSLITEIYFTLFDQWKRREYEGLIDYAKIAWINGKKTSFVQPDIAKTIYLEIFGPEFAEMEFGIFVADSGKQVEKLKKIEGNIQNFLQNGTKGSTIVDIINSDNFAEIKQKMFTAEQKMDEYNQQMEKVKGDQQQQMLATQDQMADKQHQRNLELEDRKGEWKLKATELQALGMEKADTSIILQEEELAMKEMLHSRELSVKEKEISAKAKEVDKKVDAEKYKADKALEASKISANRPKSK